jgi:hypothetical protein
MRARSVHSDVSNGMAAFVNDENDRKRCLKQLAQFFRKINTERAKTVQQTTSAIAPVTEATSNNDAALLSSATQPDTTSSTHEGSGPREQSLTTTSDPAPVTNPSKISAPTDKKLQKSRGQSFTKTLQKFNSTISSPVAPTHGIESMHQAYPAQETTLSSTRFTHRPQMGLFLSSPGQQAAGTISSTDIPKNISENPPELHQTPPHDDKNERRRKRQKGS